MDETDPLGPVDPFSPDTADQNAVSDIAAAASRAYRPTVVPETMPADSRIVTVPAKGDTKFAQVTPHWDEWGYYRHGYVLVPITIFLVLFVLSLFVGIGVSRGEPLLGLVTGLALVPAAITLFYFYWYRAKRHLPMRAACAAFLLGVIAASLAGFPELWLDSLILLGERSTTAISVYIVFVAMSNYFVVAVIEEGVKFLIVILVKRWKSVYFSPIGTVMIGMSGALGFASLENIMYVTHGKSVIAQFSTAIMRALMAVPSHAVWGALIGIGVARRDFGSEDVGPFKVLLVPVALHGSYDFVMSLPLTVVGNWIAFGSAIGVVVFGAAYLYHLYRTTIPALVDVSMGHGDNESHRLVDKG